MTAKLYQEWISDWDRKLRAKGRHILLLQDNFSGHKPPDGLTNICVENFEPNLTAHIQPMDQGIIQCFKAHYRIAFIQRSVDKYDSGTTCYITVGTFARRGLSSTAKTLRSLSGVRGSEF